jgi:hypothetical protein
MCFDLEDGVKHLDEWVDYMIKEFEEDEEDIYKYEGKLEMETLFEITNYIVDEWVSDMGINGYVIEELERKAKEKGIEVIE